MIRHLTHTFLFLLIASLFMITAPPAHADIVYVDWSATGANNGSSWDDAYTDLQDALASAASGDSIWVAAGIYNPTSGTDRTASFQLLSGVAIYGGFDGTETSISERDLAANVTILSGDINTEDDDIDNSYHVVVGSGTDSTAVLDGFTITGGHADGGGLDDFGGGMYSMAGSPTIINAIFSNNYAYSNGGGVFNNTGSRPIFINVVFNANTASWSGGGGAGMGNSTADPTLINVTFSNNSAGAGYGGGMFSWNSNPKLVNAIIWGNSASRGYNYQIWNNTSTTEISFSLIEGCGGSGVGWDPAVGVDGGNNIDVEPLFVDENLRLAAISPAVNSGNSAYPNLPATDRDGNPRVAGIAVDMGAYEKPCPPGEHVYVDAFAAGANDGTSWTDAFKELREALEWGPCESVTEIWVAAGTYKPTAGGDREATFQLQNGVTIYGGFAGWETSVSERDVLANETFLSGDIGTVGNSEDNSYHVVTGSGTNSTAVLDGFTITGGYADHTDFNNPRSVGGGMYIYQGSPTIRNLIFSGNSAVYNGGGGMINSHYSDPTLINVTFSQNSTDGSGGGIFNYDHSNPMLINVMFRDNSASWGGGVMNILYCNPQMINVTFSNNSVTGNGGGIYNKEGSEPTLVNTILWGNTADQGAPQIYNATWSPYGHAWISYSLIEGSGGSGAGWDTDLGSDGGNNIDADPLFVDAPDGDLRLIPSSPAVDAGDSASIPGGVITDLAGNPRVVGDNVDMGAYESQASCPPGTVLYVDANATTGTNAGTSWTDAFLELRYALDWVPFCPGVTEIWVAAGTYKPTGETDRTATFQLLNGIAIYGGFAGVETSVSERDWTANATILSGDIGVEDITMDNSYHVVTGSGTDATAVLDGFTITGGRADESVTLSTLVHGAGQNDTDVKPNVSGAQVVGSRNMAAFVNTHGGGMYNNGGSPTLRNLIVSDNYADDGGGMYNDTSSPTLMNVTFSDNSGLWGGAIHNYDGNPTLVNVLFVNNDADFGAGVYNSWSNPELVNVTLSNGRAFRGGGIYNNFSLPVLVNAVLWGNSAQAGGHEIYNASGSAYISYSLIAGSGGSGSWNPSAGIDRGSNIDADPLFLDGPAGDLRLLPGSPAMNAGNNTAPGIPATDLDGNTRIMHGTIDMGAYEFQDMLCPAVTVLYVDSAAVGANDGSSWSDAFTDLQAALFYGKCPSITEIWVAAGTYKPTVGIDRTATFRLSNGTAIYGGFAGTETNLSQRDWAANVTILSGDIGATGNRTDNSYHVVTGDGTDATAILDGFTITGGNANGPESYWLGGGMYNNGGNPTLANIVFSNNEAIQGAGMYNDTSSPTLINVIFSDNESFLTGGMVTIYGAPTLINVLFMGNTGWYHTGGMENVNSNPTLTNVTFSDNDGKYFGGMSNRINSNPILVNTIFWGNLGSYDDQIGNEGSTPVISYSLIEGSGGSGAGWDPALGSDGGNNIDTDPLFVDAPGDDLRLSPGSPAIDAGINTAVPACVTTDLDGNYRFADGTIDMGPYESAGAIPSVSAFPSPLVFAEVPWNETTCDTIYIVNDGGAMCTIAGIYGCATASFSMDTTLTDHALAPGDTTKIVVCATPTAAGLDTAAVTIVSYAYNSPTVVRVWFDVITAVEPDMTPQPFRIVSVSPNPFNPSTTLHFTLPVAMPVTAVIYSVTGARIRTLANGERFNRGYNRLTWDGRTDRGSPAASGVYFIRIKTRLGAKVARAVLLK